MASSRRVLSTVAVCLLAVLPTVVPLAAQTYSPRYQGTNARVIEFDNLPAAAPRRFAVIGDVANPGVYETTTRRVYRGALLKAAGSYAAARGGVTTHHALSKEYTAIFDTETSEAAHGDVLVMTSFDVRRPSASGDFHVALIGLRPDPVVVRLPPSERSLQALFSRLKQTPEPAATATVNGGRSEEPLKNGDVIVVYPQLIDRSILDSCDAIVPVRSLDKAGVAPTTTKVAEPEAVAPAQYELPLLETPWLQAGASSERSGPAGVEQPESSETVTHSRAAIDASQNVADVDVEPRSRKAAAATVGDSSIRTLVVLLALGTLGIGVALLWIASERRLRTATPPAPVPLTELVVPTAEIVNDLDQLIRGELAIEDEPVVLPARISLHGLAVGQRRLIIHPPQALAGPHFASMPDAADKPESARTTRSEPYDSRAPAATVTRPVRSAKDTEGLLDRVLLAMQREGRR